MKLSCAIVLTLEIMTRILIPIGLLTYSIIMIGNIKLSMDEIDDIFSHNHNEKFSIINFLPNLETILHFASTGIGYLYLITTASIMSKRLCQGKTQKQKQAFDPICTRYCIFDQYSDF